MHNTIVIVTVALRHQFEDSPCFNKISVSYKLPLPPHLTVVTLFVFFREQRRNACFSLSMFFMFIYLFSKRCRGLTKTSRPRFPRDPLMSSYSCIKPFNGHSNFHFGCWRHRRNAISRQLNRGFQLITFIYTHMPSNSYHVNGILFRQWRWSISTARGYHKINLS